MTMYFSRYEYRRFWHLKPLSRWCLPKLYLTLWDVLEISLDAFATAKLVRNTSAVIQGTKSVFGQIIYFYIYKTFVMSDRRIAYYRALCYTLMNSVFEASIKNASL